MRVLTKLITKFNPDFLWTVSYQICFGLGGILLVKFLSTSMTTESYGGYMLLMSIISFIVLVPFSPLIQGVTRFVALYSEKKQLTQFLFLTLVLFSMVMGLYLLLSGALFHLIVLPEFLKQNFRTFIIFGVTEIFRTLFYALNNARLHRKNICVAAIIEYGLKIGFISINSTGAFISLGWVLIILTLGNCLAIGIIVSDLFKATNLFRLHIKFRALKFIFLRIFRFSMPLIIWAPFGWVREMSNRWYLDYFVGIEEVAFFSMMATIAMIAPLAMQNLFGGYLIPLLYKEENQTPGATNMFLKRITPVACLAILLATVFVYMFKVDIIQLISDERYVVGATMLPMMFFIYAIYVFSMILTIGIFAENKTELLILPNIAAGVVSILSGFFLVKSFGLDGAFYSYFLTFSCYSCLVFYVVIKNMRKAAYVN